MDNIQIETAQNVKINQKIAQVTDRILATIIDGIIIFLYIIAAALLFSSFIRNNITQDQIWIALVIIYLPVLLYHFLFEYFMDGQTPGKKLMGIKVVNVDGTRPKLPAFLLRWIFRLIEIQLLFGSIAMAVILFYGRGQRLGDMVAGTMVIDNKRKKGITRAALLAHKKEEAYVPVFPQVTVMEDKDIERIKEIYRKASSKYDMQVMKQLANKIKSITGIESDMPEMKFVKTVIKDYYHLTREMS